MAEIDTNNDSERQSAISPIVVNLVHFMTILVLVFLVYMIVTNQLNWSYVGLIFVFPFIIAIMNSLSHVEAFDLLAVMQVFCLIGGVGIIFVTIVNNENLSDRLESASSTVAAILIGIGLGGLPKFRNVGR